MKIAKSRGYTLLELMIVLVMIAILAAVTVPKLMEVSQRNRLGELTNMFQEVVAEARSLAIKSRRAVVVEIRNGSVWVNLLDSVDCTGDIRKRCFRVVDTMGAAELDLETTEFSDAGIDMCNLRIATIDAAGGCVISSTDWASSGVGLCYNGSGQLWIREDVDTNTECGKSDAPSVTAWNKACVPWVTADAVVSAVGSTLFSGADIRFNRFSSGAGTCPVGSITPTGAEDITRRVLVPAGGHPFVKMAQTDK